MNIYIFIYIFITTYIFTYINIYIYDNIGYPTTNAKWMIRINVMGKDICYGYKRIYMDDKDKCYG